MTLRVLNRSVGHALCTDLDAVSIKRLAWAFGCAKKDSEEESALYRMLITKVESILANREVKP